MSLHEYADKLLVVDAFMFDDRPVARIKAGAPKFVRRSFDGTALHRSPVEVGVYVSPTGRSVQVWINGERAYMGRHSAPTPAGGAS